MAKKVLLVEDEDNIALALGYLIGKQGYEMHRVGDGDAALTAVADHMPDLIVLDVMLPGRSGYEVCQTIRRDPALNAVRILMMTARGGEVERRKGLALGADAFMTKPFSAKELVAKIDELLTTESGDA
ncbi:response regulator transcription factor [Actibacterium sp.]|uniref:response regulator transcription factor n=1 Tax=Actibacterium sp. TaxID=1872125 RepID=UPI003564D520